MPLNKKGKKIKKAMTKQYGKKKGEKVFYAMENSGKVKKVKKLRGGGMDMGNASNQAQSAAMGNSTSSGGGGGRDPSAQYKDSKALSQKSKQALVDQRNRARARISPSTTAAGNVLKGIGVLGFGIPTQITGRMIDRSSMAFGVPKSTRTKKDTTPKDRGGDGDGDGRPPVIPGPIPINQPMNELIPIPRIRPTVSPTGVFNYSFRKGGMLRQGKPKLAKKGWK
jgi:hypothetical protein